MTVEKVRTLASYLVVALEGYDSLVIEKHRITVEIGLLPENPNEEQLERAQELEEQLAQLQKAQSSLLAQVNEKTQSYLGMSDELEVELDR